MNKSNKIQEAEVQLENREHYKLLEAPMVNITQTKANQNIDKLHRGKHIDDMTKKKVRNAYMCDLRVDLLVTLIEVILKARL